MNRTGIVIVHYQHTHLTQRCLESLSQFCPEALLYVVDNSPDYSSESLHTLFPCCWIRVTENNGYGAGCNKGIRQAFKDSCTHILILNNDTYIDSNICQAFQDYSQQHPQELILTSQIRYPDQSIWYAGGCFSLYTARAYHFTDTTHPSGPIQFASGCVLWISAQTLDKIKGFDETYFLYLEDAELGLKAQQFKINTHYVAEAIVYHQVSASTGGKYSPLSIYYQNRNRIKILKQYGKLNHWLVFIPFYLLGFIKRSFNYILKQDKERFVLNCKALLDGLLS